MPSGHAALTRFASVGHGFLRQSPPLSATRARRVRTGALWDTGRIGRLAHVSNQSLQGLLPSFEVLADIGIRERRRTLLRVTAAAYVVLCSSFVWLWVDDASGIDGFLGSNMYVWITIGMLLGLPVRETADKSAMVVRGAGEKVAAEE